MFMVGYSWQSVPEAAPPKYKNHDQGLLCSTTKTQRITLNRSSRTRKSSFSTRSFIQIFDHVYKNRFKNTVWVQLRTLTKSILFYFFPLSVNHLYRSLRNCLLEKIFNEQAEVKTCIHDFLKSLPELFYSSRIQSLDISCQQVVDNRD